MILDIFLFIVFVLGFIIGIITVYVEVDRYKKSYFELKSKASDIICFHCSYRFDKVLQKSKCDNCIDFDKFNNKIMEE